MASIQRVASHEAGHAVLSVHLGHALKRVTIVPAEGSLGHCSRFRYPSFRPDVINDARTDRRLRELTMISLAGMAAEGIALERRPRLEKGQEDYREALDLALYADGSGEAAGAYVRWLWLATQDILKGPLGRLAMEALIEVLLKEHTVTGRRTAEITRANWTQARQPASLPE